MRLNWNFKVTLVFFILFLNCIISHSQTLPYAPFPDSAVVWSENLIGPGTNCCCTGTICIYENEYQIFTQGDTVVNSFTYTKIYKSGFEVSYMGGTFTCPTGCINYNPDYYTAQYVGALRQDIGGKKVYLLDPATGNDTLLYDFDIELGDTLPPSYVTWAPIYVVTDIDSALVGNQYHRRFWISQGNFVNFVALIEGIGSITGLLYPLLPIGPGPQDPFVNTLTCVTIDNQPVYPDTTASCPFVSGINQQEEFSSFSIYPNPVSEGATIIFPSAPKGSVAEVLDYKGQLIESLLFKNGSANWNTCHVSKGFYVIRVQKPDGSSYAKKVVVK